MSSWSHTICDDCWNVRHPNRQAVKGRFYEVEPELCCFCGRPTTSRIYVRHDPAVLECRHNANAYADAQRENDNDRKTKTL